MATFVQNEKEMFDLAGSAGGSFKGKGWYSYDEIKDKWYLDGLPFSYDPSDIINPEDYIANNKTGYRLVASYKFMDDKSSWFIVCYREHSHDPYVVWYYSGLNGGSCSTGNYVNSLAIAMSRFATRVATITINQ